MNIIDTVFQSCCVDGNDMYFMTEIDHILMHSKINNQIISKTQMCETDFPDNWRGAGKVLFINQSLYLFEQNGKRMIVYSLENFQYKIIDINCNKYSCINYAGIHYDKNYIYIIQSFSDIMLIFDIERQTIKSEVKLCPDIDYKFINEQGIPDRLFSSTVKVENSIWVFLENYPLVLCYDTVTSEIKKYEVTNDIIKCIHADYYDNKFYLLNQAGMVFSLDAGDMKINKICDFQYTDSDYPKIMVTASDIWLLPDQRDNIKVFNFNKQSESEYTNYPDDFKYLDTSYKMSKYWYYDEYDNYVYWAMHSGNYMLSLNRITGQENWIKIKAPDLENEINYYKHKKSNCIPETETTSLEIILKNIELVTGTPDTHKKSVIGQEIWKCIEEKTHESM